jgi:hypothetical protein
MAAINVEPFDVYNDRLCVHLRHGRTSLFYSGSIERRLLEKGPCLHWQKTRILAEQTLYAYLDHGLFRRPNRPLWSRGIPFIRLRLSLVCLKKLKSSSYNHYNHV